MSPPSSGKAVPESKRERSRIIQREYRKRHASKFQDLQGENQRLRNALKKIHRLALQRGRRDQELEDVLAEVKEIAELQGDDSRVPKGITSSEPETGVSPMRPETLDQYLSLSSRVGREVAQAITSRVSLEQQIWTDDDRVVRLYDTPTDAAQFLGDGLSTLGGTLYWACTRNTIYLWQMQRLSVQGKPVAGHQKNILGRLFNHSKHLTDHDFLTSMALVRLEYRKKGYIELPPPAARMIRHYTAPDLSQKIRQEYIERGESMEWWKGPQELEKIIKSHLEPDEVAELQALIEGRGTQAALNKYSKLIAPLVENFVCFGDAPRWNMVFVSLAIGSWRSLHGHSEASSDTQELSS
ncbi:hypothetical protein FZEAL_1308 [Fusarium zealandicum]|uniref:Uncharacterized protein n=1 Tax=Fusarium zealandicum TaxID=1053134 RepID=A0A8H4UTP4_9HYPO|nr:hypothetical protein FZEAL_1308 [Fusarium zealandicum]